MEQMKTIKELIVHMENKGIQFNIIDKSSAEIFLRENNYYKKLSSYRKNYDKNENGKYINLEFAYLKELSTIDMYLRYIILDMCLDIEHSIKTKMLYDIEQNKKEDGYNIVDLFLQSNERCLESILRHKSNDYCRELIMKYSPNFPIWVFFELISFGDLVKFLEFYNKTYPKRIKDVELLYNVRNLRNASAHSNCLINKLHKGNAKASTKVINFVIKKSNAGRAARQSKLSNKTINDFLTLIYVYDKFVMSENLRKRRFGEIKMLFDNRMVRHKDYFVSNNCIIDAYNFVKKIVDNL